MSDDRWLPDPLPEPAPDALHYEVVYDEDLGSIAELTTAKGDRFYGTDSAKTSEPACGATLRHSHGTSTCHLRPNHKQEHRTRCGICVENGENPVLHWDNDGEDWTTSPPDPQHLAEKARARSAACARGEHGDTGDPYCESCGRPTW